MELSLGFVIEIVNNLFQAFYLVGFLYLFFEKKNSEIFNIISYCTATLMLFMLSNYYTYHELTFNHSDVVFGIAILLIYSLICFKGKVIIRIIMPIVDMLISAICSLIVFHLFSLFGKRPFVEALTFSNAYRYLFMVVLHATTLFVYWLVLRVSKKEIRINNIYEIVVFIVVPIVSLIGVYSVMIAYEHTDFVQEGLLGLFCAVRTFEPDGGRSFCNYALLVAERRLISIIRRQSARKSVPESAIIGFDMLDADVVDTAKTPEDELMLREQIAAVKRRLREVLSRREFEVLSLYTEGLSYAQIAQRLSVSPKAVDNALQRVRRKVGGMDMS